MATVDYDPTNDLHQKLFTQYKKDILEFNISNKMPAAQFKEDFDDIDIIISFIANNELNCDQSLEDEHYICCGISNNDPQHFELIVAYEYIDCDTEEDIVDYIKMSGEILIKDDKEAFLNIDPSSLDFATEREFTKSERSGI